MAWKPFCEHVGNPRWCCRFTANVRLVFLCSSYLQDLIFLNPPWAISITLRWILRFFFSVTSHKKWKSTSCNIPKVSQYYAKGVWRFFYKKLCFLIRYPSMILQIKRILTFQGSYLYNIFRPEKFDCSISWIQCLQGWKLLKVTYPPLLLGSSFKNSHPLSLA